MSDIFTYPTVAWSRLGRITGVPLYLYFIESQNSFPLKVSPLYGTNYVYMYVGEVCLNDNHDLGLYSSSEW